MHGKPAEALRKLKDAGYHIEVGHHRLTEKTAEEMRASREGRPPAHQGKFDYDGSGISAKGGSTRITISRVVGGTNILQPTASGVAWCSPYDAFNKNLGLRIALGRALDGNDELQSAAFA